MSAAQSTFKALPAALANAARRAGERLRASGYTEAHLRGLLGVTDVLECPQTRLPLWLHRTAGQPELHLYLRLFLAGQKVSLERVSPFLPPAELTEWEELGLVRLEGGEVAPRVRFQPWGELLIASDPRPLLGAAGADTVLGISRSTLSAACMAVAPEGGRLLDLGTGGGALALTSASRAERVVGTDLNARALQLAVLNAALNGVENVEFRQGDCYAPVAGEQFDRILANPPFVVSPERRFVYRDGGAAGDGFSARVAREASAQLAPGGIFQMLCNWAHVTGEDWRERVHGWLPGAGYECLVLRAQTLPVDEYAVAWLAQHPVEGAEAYEQRFQEWLEYYRLEGIEEVSLGLMAIRRREGSPGRVRILEEAVRLTGPCGGQLLNMLEALEPLELPDEALLRQRFRLAPGLRCRDLRQPVSEREEWTHRMAWVEQPQGLPHQEKVSPELALALSRCDGRRSLEELGTVWERESNVVSVRLLLERGFLEAV